MSNCAQPSDTGMGFSGAGAAAAEPPNGTLDCLPTCNTMATKTDSNKATFASSTHARLSNASCARALVWFPGSVAWNPSRGNHSVSCSRHVGKVQVHQNHFHQNATFIKNHFHQNATFIRNHFHLPVRGTHHFRSKTNIVRVLCESRGPKAVRRLHTDAACAHLWGQSWTFLWNTG